MRINTILRPAHRSLPHTYAAADLLTSAMVRKVVRRCRCFNPQSQPWVHQRLRIFACVLKLSYFPRSNPRLWIRVSLDISGATYRSVTLLALKTCCILFRWAQSWRPDKISRPLADFQMYAKEAMHLLLAADIMKSRERI
ncbi:uncharacterized protein BT62DRAFT_1010523 [Guyanagaster necrorhizus]|uniref:Uncharacterized protein n=1 Tax=Guyanagaster necrorhizus TaxID=856835 RepID=A0A9P7VJG3_9AGAR|nr:uncharacterized protein BT62DRAFT_1010523 [Guyanagaster necrorhizus MCA 3950]KAG7442261.1 hypothetical protein BT62DRAFT_1010523 [Guyanagaster necrorhizus MCA 3950]